MAGMTVEELQVLITAKVDDFNRQVDSVKRQVSGLSKSTDASTQRMTKAFSLMKKAVVALGIGKAIKDSIKIGMDYIEDENLYQVSMGKWADATRQWSEEVQSAVGLSAAALRKNTGVIYNMTTAMGLSENNALKMSKGISLLAQDMASFYNMAPDEAFEKIQSGITGMALPLKRIGILVDDNTITQVAYNKGIAQQGAELTEQQKVLARYVAILQQTTNAQGDLARSLNTPTNQLRLFKTNVENLGIAFSQFLMPILQAIMPVLNAIVVMLTRAFQGLASLMGVKIGATEGVQSLADSVGSVGAGLDTANGSAKKLKQTLAGFDEMNVLKEPEDSGGGGGGAGAGAGLGDGGFELAEYNAFLDQAKNKTEEIIAAITNGWNAAWNSQPVQIFVNNIRAQFESIGLTVKTVAKRASDEMSKTWQKILPNVQKITGNVSKLWTDVNTTIADSTRRYAGQVAEAWANVFSGLWSIADPVITAVTGAWATFSQQLVDMWDRSGQAITDGLNEIYVTLLNAVGSVASSLGGMFATIMPTIQSGWELMTGFGVKFFEDYMLALAEWSPQIIEGMAGLFNSIIQDTLTPFADLLASMWSGIWDGINKTWENHGKSMLSSIGEFVNKTIGLFQSLWDNILAPLLIPFLEGMKNAWETSLKPMIDKVFEFVAKLVEAVTAIYNNFIAPIVKFLMEILQPRFAAIGSFIGGVFNTVVRVIGDAVGAIFGVLGGLLDFITGIFTGNWGKAWDGVKQIFSNVIDGLVNILKAPINLIIDVINGFIGGLNAIKIPDWVPVVGGKGINIPKIPKLARGGVVDGATIAMIGESGREAVLPLENNTGWIRELADAISEARSGGQPIALTVNVGEDTLLDKVIDGVNSRTYLNNAGVFNV